MHVPRASSGLACHSFVRGLGLRARRHPARESRKRTFCDVKQDSCGQSSARQHRIHRLLEGASRQGPGHGSIARQLPTAKNRCDVLLDGPPGDRRASAGAEHPARQSIATSSWSVVRLGRKQSRLPRSKRIRKRSIPNQWHLAPGRSLWIGTRSGVGVERRRIESSASTGSPRRFALTNATAKRPSPMR
jgi:hypothetical protein